VPWPAWAIDRFYSRGFFRFFQGLVTWVSNLAPFAWIDLFLVTAFLLVAWRVVALARAARRAGVFAGVWEGARRLGRATRLLAIVFLVMWGFNYRRVPLSSEVPAVGRPLVSDLRDVVLAANTLGARLRPTLAKDRGGFDDVSGWLQAPLNDALVALQRPTLV